MNVISDGKGHQYNPPLPTSLIQDEGGSDGSETHMEHSTSIYSAGGMDVITYNARKNGESAYQPPLPNSLLEIKSTRGKHSTEKPVALMEWILKYYSKEDDVVLDATMGSGSMGVACINMKRNFIGIEMDEDIYNVAVGRIEK
jgi:site-specific DNA-methyltransferase (adenine-specific)